MIRKIGAFIRNKFLEYFTKRRFERIEKNTIKLRQEQKSDFDRWRNASELLPDWNERTEIIASMIYPGSNIIEFGAGSMWLKNHLPDGCKYVPTDIIARTPDMQVCDLNKRIELELSSFDTAVFSGVLEYVYDVRGLLQQLNENIPNVVLSYACSDHSSMNRLNKGWLSDFSFQELTEIISETGYEIVDSKDWRFQVILKLQNYRF